jgi:hypothetical protein
MKVAISLFSIVLAASGASGCCEKLKKDAEGLVNEHEKCKAGDTCVVVSMYDEVGGDTCLGPFQCTHALNEKSLSSFIEEAKEISDDFKHCNECTMADCLGGPFDAHCDETAGRCVLDTVYLLD